MKRQMKEGITRSLLFISGLGIGAGAAFLLDPIEGDYRRARVKDQASNAVRQTGDLLGERTRDIRDRAQNLVTATTTRFRQARIDDEMLIESQDTEMGKEEGFNE